MELIWLIAVVIMVVNAIKKQGGKNAQGGQSVPNQQRRPSVPNQQRRPSVPNQQSRPSVPNQQSRPSVPNQQSRPSVPNQQARPSVPNQQSWPSASGAPRNQSAGYGQSGWNAGYEQRYDSGREAMLQKQRELKARLQQRNGQQESTNTNADELEQQMEAAAAMNVENSSELMREVNDLMITGYQADISFERDFLWEGMELLNRYEIGNT